MTNIHPPPWAYQSLSVSSIFTYICSLVGKLVRSDKITDFRKLVVGKKSSFLECMNKDFFASERTRFFIRNASLSKETTAPKIFCQV